MEGLLRIRLDSLWWYVSTCKLDNNKFVTKNPDTRLREINRRQKFVLEGIERFSKGLKILNEEVEFNKMQFIKETVERLEHPKPQETTDKRKLDESLFWDLIGNSRKESHNKIEFLEILKNKLGAFRPNEIKRFDKFLRTYANELKTQRNWALAYIFRQGCGDDEFDYFRAWVISMGLNAFNIIKEFKTEKISDLLFSEDSQFEEFMYLSEKVYEEKTFGLMKSNKIKESGIIGELWNENNIESVYPEIFGLYKRINNR